MLRQFDIKSSTVWPLARKPGDKSASGYYRRDFEKAWCAYCGEKSDTTTQSSTIKVLRGA